MVHSCRNAPIIRGGTVKAFSVAIVSLLLLALPTLAYEEVDRSTATATAWSVLSGYPTSYSIDGDFGTFWSNNRTTNPTTDGAGDWYQVEWPDDIEVCYIRTEGRSYQGGYYSIPKDVRLSFSDGSTLDFSFEDTTADHYVQEYFFDADQKTTTFVNFEYLTYWHHVWEYIQYYEVQFYYELTPDTDPPYVEDLDPDDGDTDVPPDVDIVFHCKDDDTGIDTDTIDFTAEDTTLGGALTVGTGVIGVSIRPSGVIAGDLDIDDSDINDVVCTFTPDDPLPLGDTITCTVDGGLSDNAGNDLGDDFIWTFDTEVAVDEVSWGAIKAGF
jgi:hypothetical protein